MAILESYKIEIDAKLAGIVGLSSKKMFGGVGYFIDGRIFGCIMGGVFRLKVNDITKSKFENFGMSGYQVPNKEMVMPYFEVPKEVLNDKNKLVEWCFEAYQISQKSKK